MPYYAQSARPAPHRARKSSLASIEARPSAAHRAGIAERLRHLRLDPHLEAVRADEIVAAMPVDEAKAWRGLWQDVQARLPSLQAEPANK